jgi:hypothetical protein
MGYSAPLMSELGHFPALPHRSSNGRFTSINGHKRRRILPALPIAEALSRYVTTMVNHFPKDVF